MRINEIFRTSMTAQHVYDTKEIVEVLLRDCQPYLNEIDGNVQKHVMWRGMPTVPTKGFGKKYARLNDRVARNTKSDMNDTINWFLKQHFEHPFRNGVYATGSKEHAAYFGDTDTSGEVKLPPYAIFPIGDFDYLWNTKLDDMYNMLVTIAPSHLPDAMKQVLPFYKTDNLKQAITSDREIMLWTEEYYYIEEQRLYEIGKYLL